MSSISLVSAMVLGSWSVDRRGLFEAVTQDDDDPARQPLSGVASLEALIVPTAAKIVGTLVHDETAFTDESLKVKIINYFMHNYFKEM